MRRVPDAVRLEWAGDGGCDHPGPRRLGGRAAHGRLGSDVRDGGGMLMTAYARRRNALRFWVWRFNLRGAA